MCLLADIHEASDACLRLPHRYSMLFRSRFWPSGRSHDFTSRSEIPLVAFTTAPSVPSFIDALPCSTCYFRVLFYSSHASNLYPLSRTLRQLSVGTCWSSSTLVLISITAATLRHRYHNFELTAPLSLHQDHYIDIKTSKSQHRSFLVSRSIDHDHSRLPHTSTYRRSNGSSSCHSRPRGRYQTVD